MSNFVKYSYAQSAFITVNFEDQILPGTLEHTIHRLIDEYIDLSAFYSKYKNTHGGRAAYDPAILLKIILFAYSKGITSSRQIQWQCEHNIVFMALACNQVPHYTGIASFVSRNPDAITAVFEQVLLVCDEQGLLGHELLAIDGCKMSSNAAKEHSGTLNELTQKRDKIQSKIKHCLKEHKRLDGRKPDQQARKKQLEKASDSMQKHFDKIDEFLKTAEPRMGRGKRPKEVKSNITDNESAKMKTSKGTIQGYNGVATVDREHQIIVDAQAFGEGQEHHMLEPIISAVKNTYHRLGISDDINGEGIIWTADTGFSNDSNNDYLRSNGINAYVPDQKFRLRDKTFCGQKEKHGKRHQDKKVGVKQGFPASEFDFNRKKKTCVCPAGKELMLLREEHVSKGKKKLFFEGRLTDCRNCPLKESCMRNPSSADHRKGSGRQVSTTWTNGKTATDWMKKRVDSDYGKSVYAHRMSTVEPVFANMGTQKGLNRFSLRGKTKVQGQWQLFCMVHNIEKIKNYGAIA